MSDIEKRAREIWTATLASASPMDPLASAAIQAIIAALTPPEGFVLAPVKPTLAMIGSWGRAARKGGYAVDIYAEMLAARPEVK